MDAVEDWVYTRLAFVPCGMKCLHTVVQANECLDEACIFHTASNKFCMRSGRRRTILSHVALVIG